MADEPNRGDRIIREDRVYSALLDCRNHLLNLEKKILSNYERDSLDINYIRMLSAVQRIIGIVQSCFTFINMRNPDITIPRILERLQKARGQNVIDPDPEAVIPYLKEIKECKNILASVIHKIQTINQQGGRRKTMTRTRTRTRRSSSRSGSRSRRN
jgi:hypothetical protein